MNLLLFSDLHCDTDAAQSLVERSSQFDVLVGAGDFGNLRRKVDVCLKILRQAKKPLVLVAGNNESTEELEEACQHWPDTHILHGSSVIIDGVTFFGIGGGIPVTPFGSWSYDFTDEEATELLAKCPQHCVLVSHSPPKGAVDVSSRGDHLGSSAIRQAIERVQPLLVVCGHIHGSAGQQSTIGKTPIVNAGPDGVEWVLSNKEE